MNRYRERKCVCVWERERERKRESGGERDGLVFMQICYIWEQYWTLLYERPPTTVLFNISTPPAILASRYSSKSQHTSDYFFSFLMMRGDAEGLYLLMALLRQTEKIAFSYYFSRMRFLARRLLQNRTLVDEKDSVKEKLLGVFPDENKAPTRD